MEYNLQEILDFDDELHEKFEEIGNRYTPVFTSSIYLNTATTLMGLMGSANSVKLGIYDLAEACDTHLYVIKILHRTVIEHYLKFYYILLRFINEKTDDVGLEYRKYSKISETLAFVNALSTSTAVDGKPDDNAVLKKLRNEYPEYDISKKELNEITFKWKHRSIVKYIKKNIDIIQDEKSFMLKLIPEFAELSSFIHGGVFAEQYYHSVYSDGKLKEAVYNAVLEVAFMTASMKVHLLQAVILIDDSFEKDIASLSEVVECFIKSRT